METVGDRYQPNGAANGGTSHLKTNVKCNNSMSHMEEGGLGDVFTTRVSARKVRDALRLRSAAQPATVDCPAGGRSREAAEQEAAVEAAVEVATGGVGASAPTAAEWDDRGEHDYISLGCSPAHLAVPLIPRHAGGGDGGASGCALVPSTPRGAPPGGAEADEEVTPPAAPHKAAAPLAGRRAVRRSLFGDQCAEGGEVMVASGGPAAPVPLATLRTLSPLPLLRRCVCKRRCGAG